MTDYTVGFKPSALRQLRKFDLEIQAKIVTATEFLALEPRPNGCKKLKGAENLYRIRVATVYRVVYEIQDRQLLVTVIKLRHRKDVYRG
jgi:mRNA interferase RelE/StbE